jgi:hypothetical protein
MIRDIFKKMNDCRWGIHCRWVVSKRFWFDLFNSSHTVWSTKIFLIQVASNPF